MKRVRAKANGNILNLPDGEADGLIAAGIYELADDETEAGTTKRKDITADAPAQTYKTRALRPKP